MNLGDLNKVWEIKALKTKPGSKDAWQMLQRIAFQVQPVMRRHNWRVKLLSEFCPSNPALLGLNVGGGVEVKLRLRRPSRDWDFYPFEQVLDTMLHELCHNQHGPHNAAFYKIWDELRKECEELVSKGITGTGQGFDAPGRQLGGFSRLPPLSSSLRQTALAAAENRQRTGSLLPSGPKTVGGNSDIMSALSPIQAAAMAAERRTQDDLWCASWSDKLINVEESGSSSSSEVNRGSSVEGNCSSVTSNRIQQTRDLTVLGRQGPSKRVREDGMSFHRPIDVDQPKWTCNICTLMNQPFALNCEACGTQKPKDPGSRFQTWSCKFCTLENNIKLGKCFACDRWRYSNGPPMSTHGPNYGT